MITDEDIEKAFDYLRESEDAAAEARALKVTLPEFRKVLKSDLEKLCNESTEAAKERFAYGHPEMRVHLEGWREAVRQDALHTFKRERAFARIEAWRTQQANERGMAKVG